MKKIDIETWNRKELFYNFLNFEDPFFNICADVNIGALKSFTHKKQESFFLSSYYLVLKTVNSLDAFKLRIRNKEVVFHEKLRGSCTVLKPNNTFGYGYFKYLDTFQEFKDDANQVLDKIKKGEPSSPSFDKDDLIHSSVIPWVSFKSFEHAKRLKQGDSVPKVVMGKLYENNGMLKMPVSVAGHHSLMDGFHVGEFFNTFQSFLDHPEEELS